jgi:hypothetical protein
MKLLEDRVREIIPVLVKMYENMPIQLNHSTDENRDTKIISLPLSHEPARVAAKPSAV